MTDKSEYSIQDLCDKTGLPRRTIHFYSQQGILPAPSSTGVGARYTDVHLLRLQLIPILRQQGLRLDEIRARLQDLDLPGLQALSGQPRPHPIPMPPVASESTGESYLHYHLPDGLILAVPSALSTPQRRKVAELLAAAQRIFPERKE
jgi:DNA-binding transcriptional MerR regulator